MMIRLSLFVLLALLTPWAYAVPCLMPTTSITTHVASPCPMAHAAPATDSQPMLMTVAECFELTAVNTEPNILNLPETYNPSNVPNVLTPTAVRMRVEPFIMARAPPYHTPRWYLQNLQHWLL